MLHRLNSRASHLPDEGGLPSFIGAKEWLNSEPLSPPALRGNVVLVQFWTYTCINWLRTMPYLRGWLEKYGGHGLVVIGIHSPEFPFEHDIANVRRAAAQMNVTYPIAIDNDFAVWRAFDNNYWPALYFVDHRGRIRHHQFGEGMYLESELVIRQLLSDAGAGEIDEDFVAVAGEGVEAAADWDNLGSPENYLGYARTENFSSPGGLVNGKSHTYSYPAILRRNGWALAGDWTVASGASSTNAPGGSIACAFHARDLHLVMGPADPASPVRYRVLIDGRPPGSSRGVDTASDGSGVLTDQRLHNLIRQAPPIDDCRFEITFLDAGAEAFAFTFS